MNRTVCQELFTWECDDISCCESYRFRVLLLFTSIALIVLAVIVALIWLSFEFRPSYRKSFNRLKKAEEKPVSDVKERSFEEARYLRRMSEAK
uniref:Uncharacterized protein n=1 Tax=Syphacia muris TaxID=451379 RepID=A0A0N5ADX3_9BILA